MIDYRDSYKKIVNVLDADDLYSSTVNNNVMNEYEKLSEIYNYLITNAAEHKCKNTIVFQINHEILQDVIQNAQTYSDTSKGIYKIGIKMSLDNLKNNINIDIRNK